MASVQPHSRGKRVIIRSIYQQNSNFPPSHNQGDHVRAPAIRRVQNISATGSTESHRVRLNLTLAVSRVTWSPSVASGGDSAFDLLREWSFARAGLDGASR